MYAFFDIAMNIRFILCHITNHHTSTIHIKKTSYRTKDFLSDDVIVYPYLLYILKKIYFFKSLKQSNYLYIIII